MSFENVKGKIICIIRRGLVMVIFVIWNKLMNLWASVTESRDRSFELGVSIKFNCYQKS